MDVNAAIHQLSAGRLNSATASMRDAAVTESGFHDKARKVAEDFESVYLGVMLGRMFSGLKTDPPFGGGHSEQAFRSMLVNEYAGDISRSGGIGLADHVYRQILALQEDTK